MDSGHFGAGGLVSKGWTFPPDPATATRGPTTIGATPAKRTLSGFARILDSTARHSLMNVYTGMGAIRNVALSSDEQKALIASPQGIKVNKKQYIMNIYSFYITFRTNLARSLF